MLISKAVSLSVETNEIKSELCYLVDSATLHAPICSPECDLYHESGCDKSCSFAPEMLSSEKGYPLEDIISPLVFELKRMGVYEPCWSCEGHLGYDGLLWKSPSVWFYTHSMTHVRVLSQALCEMYTSRMISNAWVVVVTHSNVDNPATCFSLQPENRQKDQSLESLQKDLKVMEEKLVRMIRLEAIKLIRKLH